MEESDINMWGCEYIFPEKAEFEIMDEVIVGSALIV